jgi:hypothetical protein
MTSKKILTQVKKAVQLVMKDGWNADAAIEAAFTSINDEICLEEFTDLVETELGE